MNQKDEQAQGSELSDGLDRARTQYSTSKKRGCPTCEGVDPKSCLRCYGETRMCDWFCYPDSGWRLAPNDLELTGPWAKRRTK